MTPSSFVCAPTVAVARFPENPLIKPADFQPSAPGLEIACVLNPGVFRKDGRVHLLVRVAERAAPIPGRVRVPVMKNGLVEVLDFAADDPDLDTRDPREFKYRGQGLLSTLSHLRLMVSGDGVRFSEVPDGRLFGEGFLESYGIEDPRVSTFADGVHVITYTAVSPVGYGVGALSTRDWKHFDRLGFILPIPNKDCALFPLMMRGRYLALNRPSGVIVGGNDIWLSASPDLRYWGDHVCLLQRRPESWDSERIGVNGPPILTEKGWLVLYHGADRTKRYRLGAFLLDLNDPTRVLARTDRPIMEPEAEYELKGFFNAVVFSNGHLCEGDDLVLYYGAADTVIAGARLSLAGVLSALDPIVSA
jgi:beta-1,2-mannobiose phosphorylase / 1,2-beta-oligomannan phosphorylase